MKSIFIIKYRPSPNPTVELPMGVRSAGYYVAHSGWRDRVKTANFAELYWCIGGKGSFTVDGTEVKLSAGEVMILMPGDLHKIWNPGPENWEYRWMTMDGPLAGEIVSKFGLKKKPFMAGECPVALFKRLEFEVLDISATSQRRASSTAFSILSLAVGGAPGEKGTDKLVRSCLQLIDDKFSEPLLGVEGLAKTLKTHRSRLSRLFKEKIGVSPSEYINSLRIHIASTLLVTTDFSVSEISDRVGFANSNYFSKAFRKTMGCTPRSYKGSPAD
ncbi:MAG: hypothetical protein A2X45_10520 [Lentisphaerae bacterium GWF2_50_93]|nr:MAG: hypothetical protein A2X45_10520 [Lentisphaerae bacterium GWF2_50_93]